MKKILLFSLFLLFTIGSFSQRNLIIKKNQTKRITAAIQSLLLDTLVLEDNSKLEIDDGVAAFSLIAKHVIIGYNVIIDGSRKTVPANAASGAKGPNPVTNCINGIDGKNGQSGNDGYDAAHIFLYLRIRSIGSLTIKVNGTNGTPGGIGGNGGKGADFHFPACGAKHGGKGGNGGNGGDGGTGGTVVFNYTFIDPAGNFLPSQPQLTQVEVEMNEGNGSEGGLGGQKGQPGQGVGGFIDESINLTVPVSLPGANGKAGKKGNFIKMAIKQNL